MSKSNDAWMAERKRVLDAFPRALTRDEAMQALKRIGYHPVEAYQLLDEQGVSDEN